MSMALVSQFFLVMFAAYRFEIFIIKRIQALRNERFPVRVVVRQVCNPDHPLRPATPAKRLARPMDDGTFCPAGGRIKILCFLRLSVVELFP
jgi:hypothetical protein